MNIYFISRRGFTLIELLVVIAIIGILASVVLASLNSARQKGADAAIKSNLNNARSQAELYFSNQTPNRYNGMCTSGVDDGISTFMQSAANINNGSIGGGSGSVICGVSGPPGLLYAVKARLVSNPDSYYCIDSSGVAKTYDSGWNTDSVTVCP